MPAIDHRPGGGADPIGTPRRRIRRIRRAPDASASLEARVAAAIRVTAREFAEPRWQQWATRWVAGADRSEAAAHVAFAVADAEMDAAGVPPPPVGHPAAAARTAAQLAIGLARVGALRRVGEESIASALAHVTSAMAERLSRRVAMGD